MTDETREEPTEPDDVSSAAEEVTETAEEAPPAAQVTTPLPATEAPRRLVRRPEGKMIAGVCTGLAAYLGIDIVAVRIGVVLLAAFTGIGLIGYLVAWMVMPMAPEGEPVPPVPGGGGRVFDREQSARWIGIGAIILGAIILFRNIWDFRGGIFWGLVLVGIGIAVWSREFTGPRPPRSTSPPPVPKGPNDPTQPLDPAVASPPPVPRPPPPPPPPPIARRVASSAPAPSPSRREPSVLGRLVVGAAALAVGMAVLFDNVNVLDVTAKGMFAVLLALVGLGLLIGAWWGRARWLIVPGIALFIALAISAILPARWIGSYGEVLWQPTSRSELRPLYEHGAGEAVLDLSKVKWGSKDKNIDVRLGFGQLLVVVPEDVPVEVSGRVQGGEMSLFGRAQSGWSVRETVRENGDSDLGTLDLDIQMNFGEMRVRRVESGDDFRSSDFRRGAKVDINLFRGVPGVRVESPPKESPRDTDWQQ